jgi:hypothetical protein
MVWCLVKHRDNFTFTFMVFLQESAIHPETDESSTNKMKCVSDTDKSFLQRIPTQVAVQF